MFYCRVAGQFLVDAVRRQFCFLYKTKDPMGIIPFGDLGLPYMKSALEGGGSKDHKKQTE